MSDAADQVTSAASMLTKLRRFADHLEPGERQALAALLAPGVAAAWEPAAEVEAFSWRPDSVSTHLAYEVREHGPRVEWDTP